MLQYWPENFRFDMLSRFSCVLTVGNPMDCSLPGSSVHGILQARIIEWVAISYFKRSSQPRGRTPIFCIDRQVLYHCVTWETLRFDSSLSNVLILYGDVPVHFKWLILTIL